MPEPDETRIRAFEDSAVLWQWLEAYHDTESELWVKIYKKDSGQKTVSWNDIVTEVLCWGWIDGIKKTFDDQAYLQRITPRKQRSNWSKRNCEHVERLIIAGRMQKSGLAHVLAAKADGRWDAAYAPPSAITVPEDFLAALEQRPAAKAYFAALNRQAVYAIVYSLQTAHKPETRQKRFDQFLALLERGEALY